jgi:hypothetical protein
MGGFGWGGFGGFGMGGFGMGGWGPGMGGWGGSQVSTTTEGILFIDFIDNSKKELIWQGSGTGYLNTRNMQKKEERINTFVSEMMLQYPPKKQTK